MKDSYNRTIEYLRISVTDRCNLRCRYCMPEEGVKPIPHDEILRFDEIERLVYVMVKLGIRRVRLTGGEPLVRLGIEHLAASLKRMDGIDFLGVTTNGVFLEQKAEELLKAGVNGLNISLDTTDRERFKCITCRDELNAVTAGIDAALALPFDSVKINCVLSPQSVTEDWMGVIALAKNAPVDVRLIEWMPFAGNEDSLTRADAAMARIAETYGPLKPLAKAQGGPANYFGIDGFRGKIGIIPSMTHNFCSGCNRVRLTSAGDLKTCLFYDAGIQFKPLLRENAAEDKIAEAVLSAIYQKPERHHGERRVVDRSEKSLIKSSHGMVGIGG